jgi:hypothetical protein
MWGKGKEELRAPEVCSPNAQASSCQIHLLLCRNPPCYRLLGCLGVECSRLPLPHPVGLKDVCARTERLRVDSKISYYIP